MDDIKYIYLNGEKIYPGYFEISFRPLHVYASDTFIWRGKQRTVDRVKYTGGYSVSIVDPKGWLSQEIIIPPGGYLISERDGVRFIELFDEDHLP